MEFDVFFNYYSDENKYYFDKSNLIDYLKYMKIEFIAQKCNKYQELDANFYNKRLNY